jgi:hypothetical protein
LARGDEGVVVAVLVRTARSLRDEGSIAVARDMTPLAFVGWGVLGAEASKGKVFETSAGKTRSDIGGGSKGGDVSEADVLFSCRGRRDELNDPRFSGGDQGGRDRDVIINRGVRSCELDLGNLGVFFGGRGQR